MSTQAVIIDEQELEIETKPLTLVFKSPSLLSKIDYPGRVKIEPEYALYHAERVQVFHARTAGWIAKIFRLKDASEITPDWCRSKTPEVLRVAGVVDMALKFAIKGIPAVFICPESGLHPAQQCELADFFIDMVKNPEPSTTETMVDTLMPKEKS